MFRQQRNPDGSLPLVIHHKCDRNGMRNWIHDCRLSVCYSTARQHIGYDYGCLLLSFFLLFSRFQLHLNKLSPRQIMKACCQMLICLLELAPENDNHKVEQVNGPGGEEADRNYNTNAHDELEDHDDEASSLTLMVCQKIIVKKTMHLIAKKKGIMTVLMKLTKIQSSRW